MIWHQSFPTRLTTFNLKNAIFLYHDLKQAIKQTEKKKKHHNWKKICNDCRKNGHSISRCFKRKTVKNHQVNSESRQQFDAQSKTDTQKTFVVFFKSNQNLPRKGALSTYVSPHKQHHRSSRKWLFKNQTITPGKWSSSFDNRISWNWTFNNRSRSIFPNNRNIAFHNSHIAKNHSRKKSLLLLRSRSQPSCFKNRHAHLLLFFWLIKL